MKRRAGRVVVLLLLGATVNVAVAWAVFPGKHIDWSDVKREADVDQSALAAAGVPTFDVVDSETLVSFGLRDRWFSSFNTIFYAAALWLVFAIPFALRRRRRVKRGVCPACRYPVAGSPVCTECGAAIPRAGTGTRDR